MDQGHTYALYGPLSIGSTTVLLESPILLLDIFFLKKVLNELKITILFTCFISFAMLKSFLGKKYSPANLNFDNVSKSNLYSSFFCLKINQLKYLLSNRNDKELYPHLHLMIKKILYIVQLENL